MGAPEILQLVDTTPSQRDALRARATHVDHFVLCGQRVRVCADDPARIDGFRRIYGAFGTIPESSGAPALTIWCGRPTDGDELAFMVGDRFYRTEHPQLVADPSVVLDYLLITHFRSHYFLHAGCVSRNGRGIVISGASHMGKTTLTTFLVARGMGYLSDEAAPISRADATVAPFPLELGIREGPAADLVGLLPGRPFESYGDRKKLVKADHLGRSVVPSPAPLHAVVFLAARVTVEVSTARKFDGRARVVFGATNDAFEAALAAATQSTIVRESSPAPGLVSMLFESRDPDGFLRVLRRTAAEYAIPVIFVDHEDLDARNFAAEPELLRLPQSAGIIELVKKVPASQMAELVRTEFGGSMPRLIEEVAGLTRGVAFYKLSPGRLEAMLQAVESLS